MSGGRKEMSSTVQELSLKRTVFMLDYSDCFLLLLCSMPQPHAQH